jgi:phage gp36-like protein
MAYATVADMVERFGETELIQLSDRDQTGAINDALVKAKLADADAEIDAYLAGRYSLPLPTVPTVLRRLACNIARYNLYDDRAIDQAENMYKDAVAFLKLLADGKVQLGLSEDGAAPPSTTDVPRFYTTPQRFSADTLKDFTG